MIANQKEIREVLSKHTHKDSEDIILSFLMNNCEECNKQELDDRLIRICRLDNKGNKKLCCCCIKKYNIQRCYVCAELKYPERLYEVYSSGKSIFSMDSSFCHLCLTSYYY